MCRKKLRASRWHKRNSTDAANVDIQIIKQTLHGFYMAAHCSLTAPQCKYYIKCSSIVFCHQTVESHFAPSPTSQQHRQHRQSALTLNASSTFKPFCGCELLIYRNLWRVMLGKVVTELFYIHQEVSCGRFTFERRLMLLTFNLRRARLAIKNFITPNAIYYANNFPCDVRLSADSRWKGCW